MAQALLTLGYNQLAWQPHQTFKGGIILSTIMS